MPELSQPNSYGLQGIVFQPLNPASYFDKRLPQSGMASIAETLANLPNQMMSAYKAGREFRLQRQIESDYKGGKDAEYSMGPGGMSEKPEKPLSTYDVKEKQAKVDLLEAQAGYYKNRPLTRVPDTKATAPTLYDQFTNEENQSNRVTDAPVEPELPVKDAMSSEAPPEVSGIASSNTGGGFSFGAGVKPLSNVPADKPMIPTAPTGTDSVGLIPGAGNTTIGKKKIGEGSYLYTPTPGTTFLVDASHPKGVRVSMKDPNAPAPPNVMSPGVELTPEAKHMAAVSYLQGGPLPSGMGKAAVAARLEIMNEAARLQPDANVLANKADYTSLAASQKQMEIQRNSIQSFENTALKNIDLFLDAASKVKDTGSPLLNTPVRWASGKVLGEPEQVAYNAARNVAVNEIAKITSNPNLTGTLSDSARKEVAEFNPSNATLQQSIAVMNLLKKDMANRATSLDKQLKSVRGRISGFGKNPESAPVVTPMDSEWKSGAEAWLNSDAAKRDPAKAEKIRAVLNARVGL